MPVATKPASEKQTAFIGKLFAQKDTASVPHLPAAFEQQMASGLSSRNASALIDILMSLPYKPLPESEKPKPGYYVTADGEMFVVVLNKAKTNTYAKRLVFHGHKPAWDYAPGMGRTLAGTTPLTVEAAAALGHLHGYCIICSAQLTDPKSVAAGIGPVCATRLTG
jgi:hypothetical protein